MKRFVYVVSILALNSYNLMSSPPQAPRPPQAPSLVEVPVVSPNCGKKNCDCGCKDGEPCRCASARKKACSCSPQCTCGCNEGSPCGCGAAKEAVRREAVSAPPSIGFAPFAAPAPVHYPAYQPPAYAPPAPAYRPSPVITAPAFRPALFAAPARGGNC